ncbi:autophagy protein 13 [Agyrium rufum]|nr:autophagy protein 13 [Agyrium rufum]
MHQHPRPPPKTASPANSPPTNPLRTNNPRQAESDTTGTASGRGTAGEMGNDPREGVDDAPRSNELGKLNQVIQSYFTKAALIILQSRVVLPPAYMRGSDMRRVNKWFNIELDETDALRDDLLTWRNCDAVDPRPPPMTIEIFVDTEGLTHKQCLALVDEGGKRWNVEEALDRHGNYSEVRAQKNGRKEIILERWNLELMDGKVESTKDLGSILPRVYKNSIVLFRSLYTYAKLLPAWNLGKRNPRAKATQNLPKLKYRIVAGKRSASSSTADTLGAQLYDRQSSINELFLFDEIDSPAGPFSITVTYRTNCSFQIDDSEALLSSHFIGMDEDMFEPSLGRRISQQDPPGMVPARKSHIGSLPPSRKTAEQPVEHGQAYGSLSTFHGEGSRMGSSPMSALRAAGDMGAQSPPESSAAKVPPDHRQVQGSRSSLRSTEGAPPMGRRTSVSFMPFKTPSLSASPLQADLPMGSSPRGSIGKSSPLSVLAHARTPSGVQPTYQARVAPPLPDQPSTPSTSSSPRPTPRYSSSFSHRRARPSIGGSSKQDDDNNSSGKASVSSSTAHPGSGVLAEAGAGSSGSMQTDDDNIAEFLKMIDQKKHLPSFETPKNASVSEASSKRTNTALSKFRGMQNSHAVLSDSLTTSQLLHRSSSSSSRQLSSVPPMVAGTSMSISSSPGKPISPHTPHTPAIPSRLSANSIVDYSHQERNTGRHRLSHREGTHEEPDREALIQYDDATGAIDIPTSPRPYHPSYRRSSSVAQNRVLDEVPTTVALPYGMRSASLGDGEERPPLSLSALLGLHESSDVAVPEVEQRSQPFEFPPLSSPCQAESVTMERQRSDDLDVREDERPSLPRRGISGPSDVRLTSATGAMVSPPYRSGLRIYRGGSGTGRGATPLPSLGIASTTGGGPAERGGGSGSGNSSFDQGRAGRYSFSRPTPPNFEEDEPLLFAMSDLKAAREGREGGRSVDEGRGEIGSEGGDHSPGGSRRGSTRRGAGGVTYP